MLLLLFGSLGFILILMLLLCCAGSLIKYQHYSSESAVLVGLQEDIPPLFAFTAMTEAKNVQSIYNVYALFVRFVYFLSNNNVTLGQKLSDMISFKWCMGATKSNVLLETVLEPFQGEYILIFRLINQCTGRK